MTKSVVRVLALLVATAGATLSKTKQSMEWKGAFCRQSQPEVLVARTPQEWAKVWEKVGKPAPAADLKTHFAVAVFAGQRPTGGYSVSWQQHGSSVSYRWVKPKGMAMQVITQPYDIKLFPAIGAPVKVETLPGD